MTHTPADEVPEADWAEQAVDAHPLSHADGDPEIRVAASVPGVREADEADLADQERIVYVDDDDR